MANDTAQPGKPTVVYSPLRLNWKNVVAGAVIGLLIVAIGVFSFTYYNPNATPVPPVVIKSGTKSAKLSKASASAQKKETADWKTFQSPHYKYSIKYPPTWVVTNSDEESFVVRVSQSSFERVIIQVNVNAGFCEGGTAKTKTIQVSGNEGTEISCFISGRTNPAEINYLFKDIKGNQNYVISGEIYASEEELINQLDTIKLILSTFKFLD